MSITRRKRVRIKVYLADSPIEFTIIEARDWRYALSYVIGARRVYVQKGQGTWCAIMWVHGYTSSPPNLIKGRSTHD